MNNNELLQLIYSFCVSKHVLILNLIGENNKSYLRYVSLRYVIVILNPCKGFVFRSIINTITCSPRVWLHRFQNDTVSGRPAGRLRKILSHQSPLRTTWEAVCVTSK